MGDAGLPNSLQQAVDSTKVSYKQLGRSGLRLSVPIFGCMSFGHRDWQPWVMDKEDEVLKLLKGAWDIGLTSWDTANVYSNGVSETMIGKAIKKYNIPRHKLTILTKCFGTVGEEPGIVHMRYGSQMSQTKDYVNQGGLSRQAIFNAVDASLERLQTPYIDLLQIHRYDATVPIEETMKALHDLVQSGKVRYIGASSMWAYQFTQMQFCAERNGWTKFVSMQNHYSLCYREEEREMNKFCHETGVGLIPWAPLYRGHLARPVGNAETERSESLKSNPMMAAITEADVEIIGRVQELAKKKDWKMSQVALVWIVQQNTNPIVGFSSIGRIEEAAGIRGKTLTEEECKYLEEPYKARAVVGHQ